MIRFHPLALPMALAAFALPFPAIAQDAPSPNQIVAEAAEEDWVKIAPEDLLVMTLAPDRDGEAREGVIQLMPEPFSQGWVANIRTLARAGWYDGISVNRVQDNYVVQWGDPNYDNPEAEGSATPLPDGLSEVPESAYTVPWPTAFTGNKQKAYSSYKASWWPWHTPDPAKDSYARETGFLDGFPFANNAEGVWPVHCYGMVGVGRGMSPDTGSGAELYTVIGHAPRHLDRNLAVVGRVVDGIEHLSSLPRGKGPASYYADPAKRVPIVSVRLAAELPKGERPHFEYLATDSDSFAQYVDARAHRRDPFFVTSADGADICNIPVPIRAVAAE